MGRSVRANYRLNMQALPESVDKSPSQSALPITYFSESNLAHDAEPGVAEETGTYGVASLSVSLPTAR